MKRPVVLLLLAIGCAGNPLTTMGQTYSPPASPRVTYNFNPGWKLFVGDPTNAAAPAFDDSGWTPVTLPHAWNEDSAFKVFIADLPTGIAWYRKHFVLPPDSAGKKVFLEFEGIRQAGEFYVNGQWLGRHENGVMAAGFDLTTNALPYPKENVVAVRTDNSFTYPEVATGTAFQWNNTSFYANYGGINKNVRLHLSGQTYQTLPLYSNLGTVGTYVYPQNISVSGRSADIHADTQVRNEDATAHTLACNVVIVDTNGVVLTNFQGAPVTIPPGQTNVLTASATVNNLNFWSWGYGYLYDVYTVLTETNTVLDVVRTRTGFRKTQFTDGMVRLNDRVINVKGYAQRSTDEWPAIGNSVPTWMSDLSQRMFVDSGGDTVRWMHVTPGKQLIESCDRQGLMEAMPAGDAEGDVTGRQWDQRTELMRDAIIYNKNNPSIVFYECGNSPITEDQMIQMKAIRDQYDPFGGRAMGSRSMMGSTNAEYGGEMLYIDKSATKPMWMMEYMRDEGLRKYWDDFSPPYHAEGSGSSYDGTNPADYVNHNQDVMAMVDVINWDDYYVQRPGTGTRVTAGGVNIYFSDSNTHCRGVQNYRRSGEVDPMRIPKDGYWAHWVIWNGWVDIEQPRLHLLGHWNYTNGAVKNITAVSSAAYVELFRNGQSLGYGSKSYDFLFTWNKIAWVPGTLQAVGYDSQGNQVCTDTRVTAGPAAAIRLTPILDPTGWKADGHDLAMFEVETVDALGRRCPTNLDLISYAVSGPGEWRGGIGVVSDTVPADNYILATNLPVECGVNRVLVRSTTNAGTVTLAATAPGLISAMTNLDTIPFASTNGLAAAMPGDGLAPNYSRGPTPATPSYQATRVPIAVAGITAGAGGSVNLTNTIDDNETTSWTSSAALGNNWIQFTLVRTALVSQVVVKFLSPPRNGIYPLSVQVNGTTLYNATTPATSGYLTMNLTPTRGNTVRLSRTTAGSFPILEIEFYEAVTNGAPPAAPTGLTATPVSSTQIALAWTDNATNETGFKIERSTDGVNFATVATPPLNTTNYPDTGLAPVTPYFYRVRASNSNGDSTNATASATTLVGPPPAPGGLNALPGDTQISLSWNPSGGATNYVVLRSLTNGGPYTVIAVTNATAFQDINLVNGTTYYYVVYAVGANGQSSNSSPASAVPFVGVSGAFWINTVTTSAQNWTVNSNWSSGLGIPNGPVAAASVTAGISANQTINLNQSITLGSLSVGAAGGAFNLSGNGGSLTWDNTPDDALLVQTAASQGDTISAPMTNNGVLDVRNDSANFLNVSGSIAGAGDINFDGNVSLGGANTFGGLASLADGTLQLANPLALQNSTLEYDNGNLTFNGITSATLGGLSGAQNLSLVNAASAPVALTAGGNGLNTTYTGGLSGGGSLTKAGAGRLTLSGANTQTGNTLVQGGNLTVSGGTFGASSSTIQVGNGSAGISFTVTGGLVTAGTLNVAPVANSSGDSAAITGSGSAVFGSVNLGSSGNTSGPLTINTTGSVALGVLTDYKDLAGNGPGKTSGLIINSGTVTATSVVIQNAGSGANLNLTGGALTIGNPSSTGAFKIGNSTSTRGGYLTMTGGSLAYLGTDGLLLNTASGGANGANLSGAASVATLTGITLNQVNAASATSWLVVSNGATLYLGSVGLVINQPGATVFAALGTATVGAVADWSSAAPMILTGVTTFQAMDGSSAAHNILLNGVLSGAGGLTKTGAGTLTLGGLDTYAGATTVSMGRLLVNGSLAAASAVTVADGGTLGGTGTINGPVTIQSGGTLSPGNTIGTLAFGSSLTLAAGSTNLFKISKAPLTNDVARVFGALTNGGALIVTNVGVTAFAAGDSFKLFNAATYRGAFSRVMLPPLPAGLGWNTNALNASGTLSVGIIAKPFIGLASLGGNSFALAGGGGVANASFYLLGTTNLANPPDNWTRLLTNQFDNDGNFDFTNLFVPGAAQTFLRLELP